MYVELDLDFLGIDVPKVGVLINQEPNELLETCHKTKLPGMVGWNLITLAYEVLLKNYCVMCLENLTVQQGQVHCCFPSFVFIIIAKQVDFNLTASP